MKWNGVSFCKVLQCEVDLNGRKKLEFVGSFLQQSKWTSMKLFNVKSLKCRDRLKIIDDLTEK